MTLVVTVIAGCENDRFGLIYLRSYFAMKICCFWFSLLEETMLVPPSLNLSPSKRTPSTPAWMWVMLKF